MMTHVGTGAAAVGALRRRIARWRRQRVGFSHMPEELWAQAVALARSEGAYAVARDLELSYAALRKRLRRASKPRRPEWAKAAANAFIELRGDDLIGATLAAGGSVVELSSGDGAKLTVRLSRTESVDLVALSQAFFDRRR